MLSDKLFNPLEWFDFTFNIIYFWQQRHVDMEVTIDIGYEQLVAAIKKLPAAKIKQLKSVLDEDFIKEKASKEL